MGKGRGYFQINSSLNSMPILKGMDESSLPSPLRSKGKNSEGGAGPREYEGRLVSLKCLVHLRELETTAAFELAKL